MSPGAVCVLLGLVGSAPAGAQRFHDIVQAGPFGWLTGMVLRTEIGPLSGGDWVDLAAADWDGDGRVDLFTGSGYGDLLFFRQRSDGLFEPPAGLGSSEPDPFVFEPTRSPACPAACDWDGDGDIDLLLASEGKLFLYETRSSEAGAAFAPGAELYAEGTRSLLPMPDCAVATVDLGRPLADLLISCPDGRVLLASRATGRALGAPVELAPANSLPRPRADAIDFDGDGAPDLVIGTADGRVLLRRGVQDGDRLAFGEPEAIGPQRGPLLSPDGLPLHDLSPRCLDWDRDGDVDILLGCRSGHIVLLERDGADRLLPKGFLQQVDAPVDAGRCAAPDLGDWNGDGREDLVLGREDGSLAVYLDEGRGRNGVFGAPRLLRSGRDPWQASGGFAVPALVPGATRGYAVLATGGGDGRIRLLYATEEAVSRTEELTAGGRPVSSSGLSIVSACDYDGDGDGDLFVGARELPGEPPEEAQPIIYLENASRPGAPPRFGKAAQIELYTGGPAGGSPLEEAGPLRPYVVSATDWVPGGNLEFIVGGSHGVDLFTTFSPRNVYPTLFLAPGEASRLLPPVYIARAAPFAGNQGILVGTEAYGIVCWYPRAAFESLHAAR